MASRTDFERDKIPRARPPLLLPPNLLEREPMLAGLAPATVEAAEAAAILERARAEHREAKRLEAFCGEAVARAQARLVGLLEGGEGVQVSGALYFAHYASSSEVDAEAIARLAERLEPLGLAPRVKVVLPSVAVVRAARQALRAVGLSVEALLTSGPLELRLRRRSVGDGEVEA